MDPVAVTGAGGYLGGRVVEALRRDGRAVRAFVRRPAPWLPVPATELELATVDETLLAGHLVGCSAVIHLAGANEVQAIGDVDRAMAETLAAGRRTATAARAAGIERLVLLSTTHVYGAAAAPGATVGASTVPAPRHPYAIARLALEHLAAIDRTDDLVVIRLTNAVGAPLDRRVGRGTLVANDLCRQAVDGPTVELRSSGHQWRDFVALVDVVRTVIAAADGAVPAGTYDFGSGTPTRVIDLAELIAAEATTLTGRATRVVAPSHEGPAPAPSHVDTRALADLGFGARTSLQAAVAETLQACLSR